MKYTKIIALCTLLVGMHTGSRAQVFQVFKKDLNTAKFQAVEVDSISHSDAEGLTTIHLRNGNKQTFQKAETDSIVWYDPANSILSTLQKKGNFTNFIQLVSDCGNEYPNWPDRWADFLSGATDQTVFVANDAAWQRFFEQNAKLPTTNPWHTAISYGALTADQKRTLLGSAITSVRKIGEMDKLDFMRIWSAGSTPDGEWRPILTPDFCAQHDITEMDQRIIFGAPFTTPWMAGAEITDVDVACTNGYIEEVSTPLTPLATMADIIRNNGQTNIFAHIMDYVQQNLGNDPYGYGPQLKFDPSWAGYHDDYLPERDIAAMFVPNDEAMWRFFTEGAGQVYLQTYFNQAGAGEVIPYVKPTTQEELMQQIDKVPAGVLVSFVNTIMMRSFVSSVPSKMLKLRDDAMKQLFYKEDVDKIKTCLMACNGAVYLMDKVYGPADYVSITAPAYVSTESKIMKWAIYDGQYMGLNYYVYLKAPRQDITLFLPTDAALAYYYDPVSMKSRTPRAIVMTYNAGYFPVGAKVYNYYSLYNSSGGPVGTIGKPFPGYSTSLNQGDITNRLKDILLNHTILNDGTQDINSRNEYYRTYGGDVVKVVRDESGKIVGAKGTFQLENERNGIASGTPGVTGCNVTASFESLTNGQTYTLDAPLVPTCRSLYSIMTNDADWSGEGFGGETPYSEFYKLCEADAYQDVIMGCGLVDVSLPTSAKNTAMKKYLVFTSDNGLDYNFAQLRGNTSYTAYIPTNEAVQQAIAQGLPTWEDISNDYNSCQCQTYEDSIRIQKKILTLTNVIKAHFHFGMAIADKEPFNAAYKSLLIDPEKMTSPHLTVKGQGEGVMTVTDWKGHTFNVLDNKNVFVRDYTCNKSPRGVTMTGITIDSYRSGVVHQIDGVLGF